MTYTLKFSYDGFGINDATDPYRPRLLTFARNTPDAETQSKHDAIGSLIEAAPDLLEALEAIKARTNISRDFAAAAECAAIAHTAIAKARGE